MRGLTYDTIRDDILTYAQNPTRVSSIYHTNQQLKSGKQKKTKK